MIDQPIPYEEASQLPGVPPVPGGDPRSGPPSGAWFWITGETQRKAQRMARRNLRAYCALWFIVGLCGGAILFGALSGGLSR